MVEEHRTNLGGSGASLLNGLSDVVSGVLNGLHCVVCLVKVRVVGRSFVCGRVVVVVKEGGRENKSRFIYPIRTRESEAETRSYVVDQSKAVESDRPWVEVTGKGLNYVATLTDGQ